MYPTVQRPSEECSDLTKNMRDGACLLQPKQYLVSFISLSLFLLFRGASWRHPEHLYDNWPKHYCSHWLLWLVVHLYYIYASHSHESYSYSQLLYTPSLMATVSDLRKYNYQNISRMSSGSCCVIYSKDRQVPIPAVRCSSFIGMGQMRRRSSLGCAHRVRRNRAILKRSCLYGFTRIFITKHSDF